MVLETTPTPPTPDQHKPPALVRADPQVKEKMDAVMQGKPERLKLTMDQKEWEEVVKVIYEPIKRPDDSPALQRAAQNPLLKRALEEKYAQAVSLQKYSQQGLAFVMNPNVPLNDVRIRDLKRIFAFTLEDRHIYTAMWEGRTPTAATIPSELRQHLDIGAVDKKIIDYSEKILQMQYDVRGDMKLERSPRDLRQAFAEILEKATRRKLTVGLLYASGTPECSKQFLEVCGYAKEAITSKELEALQLILGYVVKNEQSITKVAKQKYKDEKQMPIAEALSCSLQNYALLGPLRAIVNEAPRSATDMLQQAVGLRRMDISESVRGAFSDPDLFKGGAVATLGSLESTMKTDEEKEAFRESITLENAAAVAEFCLSQDKVRLANAEHGTLTATQFKIVTALQNHFMRSREAREAILRSCMVPQEKWKDANEPLVAAIDKIIVSGEISVRDAIQLKSLEGKNTLLALKLAGILGDHNEPKLAANVQQTVIEKHLDLIQLLNTGSIDEYLEKLGLSPEEKAELKNVLNWLKDEGMDKVAAQMAGVESAVNKWPWLALVAAGILGYKLGVVGTTRRAWVRMKWNSLHDFMQDTSAPLQLHQDLGVDPNQVRICQEEMKAAYEKYERKSNWGITFTKHPQFSVGGWSLRLPRLPETEARYDAHSLKAAAHSSDLSTFAQNILLVRDDAFLVGAYLGQITDEAKIPDILKEAGFTKEQQEQAMKGVKAEMEED